MVEGGGTTKEAAQKRAWAICFEGLLRSWEMKKGWEGVTNRDNDTDEGTGIWLGQ